ncbi:TonB-dependent receptor plug domain-containing protein [Tenacibaculum aiptasiae]|uniref:TonB-dependent receptor plug domain-containing protein n=1 Tax=Tenacibaculum aiptasiae TaxID=426481 RepID=A0A7J5ASM8_9FLAO|nr:carboxypeptidase-like regulatory domain-containing protein [Tenacibaculum aiptasiae]KAB1160637.1 TonB-dependent receptor plug domain-containing protein [Tenacibaculum aiptasiae]
MRKFKNVLLVALFFATATILGQTKLTGTVVDEMGEPLPGASVVVKGTTNGAATDFDGKFILNVKSNSGAVVVSFVGYNNKEVAYSSASTNLGTIELEPSNILGEVIVTGVIDVAKDRETPVAVSTIKAEEIQEKLGSKEFPEILNATPSVYATKQGGGFGDSRINIRGFDQSNTAVMINGMPVNDMENGWVYWSNWAGLSDVTSAIQVQRGLGSSKLAISSVGGTINVLTRSSDKKEGGRVYVGVGNDNRLKTTVSYNTGVLENGMSVSALFGRTNGDGYVDGTSFEGYSYYVALGYKNDNHDFQFTITGAPQRHNGRGFAPSLADYIRYGNGTDPNRKYNSDWGYRNGKEETFGGNFYHKPVASLNWDWSINDNSKLSSVLYASLGRGGSVGAIGRIDGKQFFQLRDQNGLYRFDDIIAYNSGQNVPDLGTRDVYSGGAGGPASINGQYINGNNNRGQYFPADNAWTRGSENGISQRSSVNSHNWFGLISNFNTQLSDELTFDVGVDLRTYKGIHYRRLVDLLGADAYIDNDNINAPGTVITQTNEASIGNIWNVFKSVDDEQKIDYYNEGKVNWVGVFTQLEYKKDDISAFIQGAISNQGFQRVDYFNYLDSDPNQTSDWENLLGGNIKGGLNWNINEKHNVFVNGGYYLKQPTFDAVFPNFTNNDVNTGLTNEKILGLELGYGFRHENYNVNVNLYRTSWKDRFLRSSTTFNFGTPQEVRGTANLQGIEQIHTGIEIDATAKFGALKVNLMGSIGNYEYGSDVTATFFDQNNDPIIVGGVQETKTLYLKDKKVGDAPQTTFRIGFDYNVTEDLKFDISQFYVGNLYANVDAAGFSTPDTKTLELPGYSLIDAGVSYKYMFKNNSSVGLRFNVSNLTDELYISESETNRAANPGDTTWRGINTRNRVYFGLGRTWNLGINYKF